MSADFKLNMKCKTSEEANTLLKSLSAHLSDESLPEHVGEFFKRFLDLPDFVHKLISFDVDSDTTAALDFTVFLNPTDCLRVFVIALGAGYFELFRVEYIHE